VQSHAGWIAIKITAPVLIGRMYGARHFAATLSAQAQLSLSASRPEGSPGTSGYHEAGLCRPCPGAPVPPYPGALVSRAGAACLVPVPSSAVARAGPGRRRDLVPGPEGPAGKGKPGPEEPGRNNRVQRTGKTPPGSQGIVP